MNCYLKSYNHRRAVKHGKKNDLVGRLILMRSDPWVHSELQFSKRKGLISFSATMQDNIKCARFKDIWYHEHPERWDTVEIPMTDTQEDFLYRQAAMMAGNVKYDLWGLLSFGTPWRIVKPDPDKMWCSEIVGHLIRMAHKKIPITPDQTHPTLLHTTCQEYFCPEKV